MSYIEKHLPNGEAILFMARRHWMRYVPPALLFVSSIAAAVLIFLYDDVLLNYVGKNELLVLLAVVGIICVIGGAWWLLRYLLDQLVEMAVTTNYIIHKKGFIRRRMNSLSIKHVEFINVDQSIIGALFGYGDLRIISSGETFAFHRKVANPMLFRNRIMEEK